MADYLVQENADKILQESGDGILLETQPSASPSVSPSTSISPSLSPSISSSLSPSISPSPSPGWEDYTREANAALPGNTADLTTTYTAQDYIDVATEDLARVNQAATDEYAIHQFKKYDEVSVDDSCTITWIGKTNCSPTLSTVYLQVYNTNGSTWETIDTDSTAAEDTDFTLTAVIADLANYRSAGNIVTCRVYQLDV